MEQEAAEQLKKEQDIKLKAEADKKAAALKAAQEQEKIVQDEVRRFTETVQNSHDLADQLQDLTDRLKKMTKATAVYIGKLV